MNRQDIEITTRATSTSTAGSCGCCSTGGSGTVPVEREAADGHTTAQYEVTGMTCGHCASTVTDGLRALDGVIDVDIDLVAGGASTVTVTSKAPLSPDEVDAAVGRAGYSLAGRP